MPQRVRIRVADRSVEAELYDTPTARLVRDNLPLKGTVNTWGDEIYFETDITASLEDAAQEVVEMGAIGYWPPGKAICIFFGPTPLSRAGEIRPYSPVNVIGKLLDDPQVFRGVPAGEMIEMEPS